MNDVLKEIEQLKEQIKKQSETLEKLKKQISSNNEEYEFYFPASQYPKSKGDKINYYLVKHNGQYYQIDTPYRVCTEKFLTEEEIENNYVKATTLDILDIQPFVYEKVQKKESKAKNEIEASYFEEKYSLVKNGELSFDAFFDELYSEAKQYLTFLKLYDGVNVSKATYDEHNRWGKSLTNEENIWSRIFLILAFFDTDKIANAIATYNEHSIKPIESAGVHKNDSTLEWRKCLRSDLCEITEQLLSWGEANEKERYLDYQSGRVHLESIFYNADTKPYLKIYWTNDECSVGGE